jgi:hypothetical protein
MHRTEPAGKLLVVRARFGAVPAGDRPYVSMPKDRLIIAALVVLSGCASNVEQQVRRGAAESFDAQAHLLLAVEAYRVGRGQWPSSPTELRTSTFLDETVGFDRFENLRFEPLPGGGLMVRSDRWTRPDGTPGMLNWGVELGPPTTAR